jgi:HEXXH motif-containing protein
MRIHELPDDVFRQVAAGGGGATAARLLCSAQHSKHLLLLRGVVDAAAAARHAQAGQARHAYELLADIQQLAPDAVDGVIRHPAVGAWAGRVLRALRNGQPAERAQPAGIAALACAAAIQAGVTCAIEVPITGGTLSFPSVGAATLPTCATTALVRCGAAGAEVIAAGDRLFVPANPQEDTPGWQALRRITAPCGREASHPHRRRRRPKPHARCRKPQNAPVCRGGRGAILPLTDLRFLVIFVLERWTMTS